MQKNKIEIIFENDDLLVINKPSGISATADRSGADDLLAILARQLPPQTDLRLVHRLDKDTSGCLLLAKNLPTQSTLSSWFEKQMIRKTYIAIVTGCPLDTTGKIKKPLLRNKKKPQIMSINPRRGKPALTEWQLLADFGVYSLLIVHPRTGRTHQIRVHLASQNLPLAVDPLYGPTKPVMLSDVKTNYRTAKGKTESPLIDRLTLHAYQIVIPELLDCPTTFIAPMDKKFKAAIKMLTKHNPKGIDAVTNPELIEKILNAKTI